MNQDKAVVISTGSLYSAILLAKIVGDYGAENVTSVYFEGDIINNAHAVTKMERLLNVPNETVALDPFLYTNTDIPFRNGVFAAIAANIAVTVEANVVYMATWNNEEYFYPDATMGFSLPMSAAVVAGTGGKVSLVFPFQRNSTTELILMAQIRRIPVEHSYSCIFTLPWKDDDEHCGTCKGCLKRIGAFRVAGIIDPAKYAIDIHWENCQPF